MFREKFDDILEFFREFFSAYFELILILLMLGSFAGFSYFFITDQLRGLLELVKRI